MVQAGSTMRRPSQPSGRAHPPRSCQGYDKCYSHRPSRTEEGADWRITTHRGIIYHRSEHGPPVHRAGAPRLTASLAARGENAFFLRGFRDECSIVIADPDRGTRGVLGLTNHPDTSEAPPGGKQDHQGGETAPLQAARCANADQLPEQHAEVEARAVNQEALQDIAMS